MEFVKNNSSNQSIDVGDLVRCDGKICIVVEVERAFVKGRMVGDDRVELVFPYILISLDTGKQLNAVGDIEYLNSRYNLVSKNKDVVITY